MSIWDIIQKCLFGKPKIFYYVYFYRAEDTGPDSVRKSKHPTRYIGKAIAYAKRNIRYNEDHPMNAIIKGSDGIDYFSVTIDKNRKRHFNKLK